MVWFYMAGFISGAVGMLVFASWYEGRKRYGKESEDSSAHRPSDSDNSQQSG